MATACLLACLFVQAAGQLEALGKVVLQQPVAAAAAPGRTLAGIAARVRQQVLAHVHLLAHAPTSVRQVRL